MDWQQAIALALVGLAVIYLVARQLRPAKGGGCSHCHANPEATPAPRDELIQLTPPPPAPERHDRSRRVQPPN